jgi:hypothetical protein
MRIDGHLLRRWAVAIAVGLLPLADAAAQEPRVERLEIIGAGFLSYVQAGERTDAPDAVGRKVIRPRNMQFIADPPASTAQIGTSFGVRYLVVGQPRLADVKLRTVWKIPAPGLKEPQNGKTFTESAADITTQIGTAQLSGYGFNEAWEIVPGTWVLQIWQGDRKLLEHPFAIR